MTDAVARRFGEGPLSRIASVVYTLLVVEGLLVATTLPGLLALLLLDRDSSNLPLVALCALPVGPAVSAALYALRQRSRDLTDLAPAAAFWRGYRLNLRSSLAIWVPGVAGLTIVATALSHFSATGLPSWWAALLIAIGVLGSLWLTNALVITSLFAFRVRDVARLGAYLLGRTPGVTLGNAGVLVVAAGITLLSSEAVLALAGSLVVALLLQTCRPLITVVTEEFTK